MSEIINELPFNHILMLKFIIGIKEKEDKRGKVTKMCGQCPQRLSSSHFSHDSNKYI